MAELRVMDALREKRFELSGVMSRLEQQLAQHRGSLAYLGATMRLFDPDLPSQDAAPSPQRERVSWFRPGECRRLIHDVLRDAPQPLATRELAERVIESEREISGLIRSGPTHWAVRRLIPTTYGRCLSPTS